MAREHARILCRIWSDEEFKQRSKGAQWMYFMLLSQRSLNHAGVLPLTVQRWANGSKGTTTDHIMQYLGELSDNGYVVFDASTEELLIRSFIRNDGVAKQPNVLKAALRQATEVDSPLIRLALAKELRRLSLADATRTAAELDPDGSGTLPEPFANPSPTPVEPRISNPSGTLRDGYAANVGEGEGESLVVKSPSVVGLVAAPSQAKSPSKEPRGTRIPEDWQPSEALFQWAADQAPDVDVQHHTVVFVDFWLAKAGAAARKVSWELTWKNWMRDKQAKVPEWQRGKSDGDQIDPDVVLGADVWTVPTPPPEIRDGPHEGIAAWHEQKRAERRQERTAEALGVLARRAA